MKRAFALAMAATCAPLPACAPRAATCGRSCDAPFACASDECVPRGTMPAIEARDRPGEPLVRRIVVAPTDEALVRPAGSYAPPRAGVLGRQGDSRALLLLRFPLDLPPGTSVVEAHVVIDRDPAMDADPAPVVLHAVRIVEPWSGETVTFGRAPRLDDLRLPATEVEGARREIRLDVKRLVQGWKLHRRDEHGIAIVSDRTSPTGLALALSDGWADGPGGNEPVAAPLPVHAPGPPPVFAGADAAERVSPPLPAHGPRLELYVKP